MTDFYEGLRDDVAAPLIAEFGRKVILRSFDSGVYDPSTGTVRRDSVDIEHYALTLPVRRQGSSAPSEFTDEVIAKFDQFVIMEAKEGVTPQTDDNIMVKGDFFRIVAVASVGPSGIPVIHKIGVAKK